MKQYTVNVQVKLSEKEAYYLDIIAKKYHYKRSKFIRDAIREKMIVEVPKLREKYRFDKLFNFQCF